MADENIYPTTATFGALVVAINTGTTQAPVWKAPCGFDSKALTLSAATSEANVPPCNNPDEPGWTARGVSAKSLQVTGSGVMASEDTPLWETRFDAAVSFPVMVYTTGETGYRTGNAVLTNLGRSAARSQNGNLIQRSITLDSDGPFDWKTGEPPALSA